MTRLAGHIIATDSFEGEPSFSPSDGRIVFSNGGWKYDLSIIENAADVIGNQASPIITHTVAVTSGKIVELKECDWNPAVTGN